LCATPVCVHMFALHHNVPPFDAHTTRIPLPRSDQSPLVRVRAAGSCVVRRRRIGGASGKCVHYRVYALMQLMSRLETHSVESLSTRTLNSEYLFINEQPSFPFGYTDLRDTHPECAPSNPDTGRGILCCITVSLAECTVSLWNDYWNVC